MSNTTQLRQNLFDALTSAAARKIDFWVEAIHVDSNAWNSVFSYVALGKIDVIIDVSLRQDVNAQYNRRRDTFLFRDDNYGASPDQKASMIHECVHAFTDIKNMFWSGYFVDEAAAYIAGFLYFQYTMGQSMRQFLAALNRQRPALNLAMEPHEAVACDIASAIASKQGAVVPSNDIDRLATLISNHPAYRDVRRYDASGANGV